MEILDIAHRAIQRSGVLPSFNRDECPEDYEQRACDVLVNELVNDMNCDRTLDMTEVALPFKPTNNILDLCCPEDSEDRHILTLPYTCDYLVKYEQPSGQYTNLSQALANIGVAAHPPRNGVGEQLALGIWSIDNKFIEVPVQDLSAITELQVNLRYNVPFPPMRVEGVYEMWTGIELDYKHAGEFVSSEYFRCEHVFMVEDYPNKVRIKFHPEFADKPVNVVLPVPIQCVNYLDSPRPWSGRIIAPKKYYGYLIAELAARTAEEYGVASAPGLRKSADNEYNKLVRNYPKRQHHVDIPKKIADTLGRVPGMTVLGSGYNGGAGNG